MFNKTRNLNNKLKKLLKEKRIIQTKMYSNIDMLTCGKYYLSTFEGKRIAYIKNKQTINFIKKNTKRNNNIRVISQIKMIVKNMIKLLLVIKIKKRKKGSFNAELIMITEKDDVKFFNFKKQKVSTYFKGSGYEQVKKVNFTFSKYFLMTHLSFNDEKKLYVEKLIDFKPFNHWTKGEKNMALERTILNYISYAKDSNKRNIRITSLMEKFNQTVNNKKIKTKLNNLINRQTYMEVFPVIQSHGDIHFKNILLSNKEYYFIDWEHSKEIIFFYDLINILVVEAMANDYSYIKNFLNGKYDKLYFEFFKKMDTFFDINNKEQYIWLYFIIRIYEFDLNLNGHKIDKIYEKYLNIIKTIESEILT